MDVPVLNKLGEQIVRTSYLIPPTVGGLCEFLGVHRSTWADYCDRRLYPQFYDITAWARARLKYYREEQLLTREGKDVRGVIFDLQNNYGYSEKREVEFGPTARSLSRQAAPLAVALRGEVLGRAAAKFAGLGIAAGECDGAGVDDAPRLDGDAQGTDPVNVDDGAAAAAPIGAWQGPEALVTGPGGGVTGDGAYGDRAADGGE